MQKVFCLFTLMCTFSLSTWTQTIPTIPVTSGITCIARDSNNNIWVGTNGQGLWKFNGTSWSACPTLVSQGSFTGSINFNAMKISDIAVDPSGGVWLANSGEITSGAASTSGGVDYLPNGFSTLYHYNELLGAGSLPSRYVTTIDVDRNGTVWAGCGLTYYSTYRAGGLAYKATGSSGFTDISSTLPQGGYYTGGSGDSRQILSVACGTNEIWVGRSGSSYSANPFTNSQIVRYSSSGSNIGTYIWQNIPVLPFAQKIVPSALFMDVRGNGWCGINDYNLNGSGGFAVKENSNWSYINYASMPTVFPSGAQVNDNAIWGDKLGHVFIGTTKGLIVYDGVGSTSDATSYKHDCVNGDSIDVKGGAIDANGDLYVATSTAIVKYDGFQSLSYFNIYNVNESNQATNYDARRLMKNYYCTVPQTALIRVAADGTQSTLFKLVSPSIGSLAGHGMRIKNVGDSQPNEYGTLTYLTSSTNDAIEFLYKHPSYKDASTPNEIEFDVYDLITNQVDMIFKVAIKRPPVLLLHGVNSDGSAMEGIKTQLLSTGFYDNYQVINPNYPKFAAFSANTPVIVTLKNDLANSCFFNNLSFGKMDFVGHSMGGILSRLYLQDADYKKDMHKIITINTPHSGSQLATRGFELGSALGSIANFITKHIEPSLFTSIAITDFPAFENLQVNSTATLSLLNGSNLNRNVTASHVITSRKDFSLIGIIDDWKSGVVTRLVSSYHCLNPTDFNQCVKNMFGNEDNDWIVSMTSQLGGLNLNGKPAAITQCSNFSSSCSLHHTEVEKNSVIISRIEFLLGQKANSDYFTTGGFHPATLPVPPIRDNPMLTPLTPLTMNITNPIMGSTFLSGTTVNFSTVGSSNISLTMFILKSELNDSTKFEEKVGYTNTFSYTIPTNITGRINVVAVGYDATGLITADTFYFMASASALPIALSVFDGKADGFINQLTWQTESEVNSDYFVIEKSENAIHWQNLTKVAAVGNSSNPHTYKTIDDQPHRLTYYRLLSMDKDGTKTFSKIISVAQSKNAASLKIYPNPVRNTFTLEYTQAVTSLKIMNLYGQLLKTIEPNELGKTEMDTSDFASGMYWIRINDQQLVKFVKM